MTSHLDTKADAFGWGVALMPGKNESAGSRDVVHQCLTVANSLLWQMII